MGRYWNVIRTPIAFLVAPLAVPFIFGAYYQSFDPPTSGQGLFRAILSVSAIVAYLGVIIFGVPIYRLLQKHKLTAFWIAPLVGFIVGAIVYMLLAVPLGVPAVIGNAEASAAAFKFAAPAGAAVGAILWLIARPDRQAAANRAAVSDIHTQNTG